MESVLDVTGHRRSPASTPGDHRKGPPRNRGERYPADPPTVEEIVAVIPKVTAPTAPGPDRFALGPDQQSARAPGE